MRLSTAMKRVNGVAHTAPRTIERSTVVADEAELEDWIGKLPKKVREDGEGIIARADQPDGTIVVTATWQHGDDEINPRVWVRHETWDAMLPTKEREDLRRNSDWHDTVGYRRSYY